MKLWHKLFTTFLKRFHLMRFFGRSQSFKELHQSSYAQEISKTLSTRLVKAAKLDSAQLLHKFNSLEAGLTEQQANAQQKVIGLNEVSHEKPLDRKSTRLNSSHSQQSRMPSSA